MSKRAIGIALLGVLTLILAVASGIRIYQVNAEAPSIPIKTYSLQQEVPLNGAFMNSHTEGTDDYSITITNAKRMSYDEYISEYGIKGKPKGFNDKSIICVEAKIENKGKKQGGISIYNFRLVPETNNTYYIPEESLWKTSEKHLPDWPNPISLTPHSSYTVHIPFAINSVGDDLYKGYIKGTNFNLFVSDSPVSNRVNFDLQD